MIHNRQKITAIVPVYNEEKTIKGILQTLTSCYNIDEIIVVDDGSTDNTRNIIRKFNVKKIFLKDNGGKGNAVKIATEGLKSGVLLFVDGDLIGLRKEHIIKLLDPVIHRKAAMVIGLRDKGSVIANMIMPYFPLTGGERTVLAEVFVKIRCNHLIKGWGLESVMNDYCRKKRLKVAKIKLDGLNHIGLQTKKYGIRAFIREIYDVVLIKIKLLRVSYD